MREILFRGKDSEVDVWHEGQYIHLHKTTYCFSGSAEREAENEIHQIVFEQMTDWNLPNRHLRADVLPETVGQFTGLKDTNFKRIFEGDILESRASENKLDWKRWKVHFEDGCFVFESFAKVVESRRKYRHEVNMLCADEIELYGLVVVGNIHDNPELMEEGCEETN